MPDLPASWVADPDAVTFAIKVLAASVLALGGIIVAGLKWITSSALGRVESQMTSFEHKLDRVATSLESLTLTTAVDIAEIRSTCKATHNR